MSGAAWAMIYTALIVAIVATTGGGIRTRGLDALMIRLAVGAGAMALATLKFNPSTAQIIRANIFGVGVGGAVLLLSGWCSGVHWLHQSPVPYVSAAWAPSARRPS